MTAKEMMAVIGKTGTLTIEKGMYVNVKITDVRKVFDRVDYLVEPAAGSGNAWVAAYRVTAIAGV